MASEIVERVVANRATTETLAEHLCARERRLTLMRELEASEAAQIGDKARQSLASTESERHRYAWAQLQLIVDDDFKSREALEARVRVLEGHLSNVIGYAEEWYRHIGWDATFGDDYNVEIKAARAALKEGT